MIGALVAALSAASAFTISTISGLASIISVQVVIPPEQECGFFMTAIGFESPSSLTEVGPENSQCFGSVAHS